MKTFSTENDSSMLGEDVRLVRIQVRLLLQRMEKHSDGHNIEVSLSHKSPGG